ncbi:MAG: DUF3426 domain-containing protein [Gammaproteobacteria bacterium]|nr:DUF3426 domain-containing protein [Gammaproteobacteria bacterium]
MYTQCPLCDTQYRISAAELKAALGKVRCAHCQNVFNALSQLTDTPPEIPTLTESVAAPAADIAAELKDAGPAPQMLETFAHPSPHSEPFSAEEHIPEITGAMPAFAPTQDSADLPKDEEPALDMPEAPAYSSPHIEPPAVDEHIMEITGAAPAFALTQAAADSLQDEEPAPYMPETPADSGLHIEPFAADEHIPEITDAMPVFAPTEDAADILTADAAFEQPAQPSRPIIPELVGAPARLMADEFAYARKKPYGGLGTALWSSGIILFLALLVVQYLYAMRNDLARTPEFRPVLEQLCAVVKNFARCEIPLRRDLTQIELQGRDIRPHPRFENALLVSVTLLNKASFRQAYPAIELTLADFNGALISRRRFQPADYLLTDVSISQGLAPQGVAQVTLEIVTPAAPLNLDLTSWDFALF